MPDPGTEHARIRHLLGPYVLGDLDPDEVREVEEHLDGCPACRDEERDLREIHERLSGAGIATAAAPPYLKERILASLPPQDGRAVLGERGASLRPRRAAVLVAAAVALLVIGLAAAYSSGILEPFAETASLSPTKLAPGAGGELEVAVSEAGAEADLEVWGLPRTGPNEYYELWFGREEGRVSAGTFKVDGEGRARLSASCPEIAGGYQRVGVTLEEFPEEPSRAEARVVLGGELLGS